VKIVYTRKALAQIDRICSYIEARDSAAALKVKTRIKRSIDRLAHRPYSARPSDRPGVRVLTVTRYPYIVLYTSTRLRSRCESSGCGTRRRTLHTTTTS
jgi:toxin ParE1/3/4